MKILYLNKFPSDKLFFLICILGTRTRKRKMTLAPLYDPIGVKPSAVDVYARLFLPLLFAAFQLVYWITCVLLMPPIPEGTICRKGIMYEGCAAPCLNRNDTENCDA